ncbi:MAG: lipopolysaccharide biosynthesis protein [Phycisphaeraceae bacterium]|nr:lipopolysaccharide biosynthesis protein [Phycisphaeraceae bacterium]
MSTHQTPSSIVSVSPPTASTSLKGLALRGSAWTVGSQLLNNAMRLVGNMVLTRLLFPQAFGLMLLVGVFTTGLKLFTDLGINQNIVQSNRGNDPDFLNTAWTLSVLRGLCLWVIACLLAWPYAVFYNEPQLIGLIPTVSICVLISGFASTRLATLNRQLALGRVCLIDLAAQFASLITTLIWALIWPTVWALVGGAIALSLTRTLLSHWALSGHQVRFFWNSDAARSLYRFGRWIFVSTILTFMARQADKILLGTLISSEALGVYGIALIWAIVPTELLQKIASQVAFPVFSRLKVSPKGLSSAQAARVRRPLSILGGMIATLLIVSGDHLIHFLYDARYADAGWMLQLLAIGVWFQMLGNSYSPAILALGKTKWLAAGHLSKFLTLIVAVPLGFYFQGIEGVLWGIAVCELAKYSLFAFVMHRLNLSQIREDIGFTSLISLIVGLCYQLNSSVDWQPITLGIVCVLITLLFWAPFSMLVVRAIQNKKPV